MASPLKNSQDVGEVCPINPRRTELLWSSWAASQEPEGDGSGK